MYFVCDILQPLLMSFFPHNLSLKLLKNHREILRKDNVEKNAIKAKFRWMETMF